MKKYSEVANRYMKQNKKRTILTIFGITLATILIFAIGTFLLSFRDTLISTIRAGSDFEYGIMTVSSEKVDKIVKNAEVKNSALVSYKNAEIKDFNRQVSLAVCNKGYFERMYTSKIIEGSKPEKEGEVIIDSNTSNVLNVGLNDNLTLVNESGIETNYIVKGISENSIYKSDLIYVNAYKDNIEDGLNYDVFINLNSKRDKNKIITNIMENNNIEINENTLSKNSELLYLTGNGPSKGIETSFRNMSLFVIAVIMVCTISVIYNSFNISVMERIKYFGILKAIGATSNQINKIIFKEGALMGLIALPLGCFIGFFALKFGVEIFIGSSFITIQGFKISFYPIVILLTAIIVSITIILSIMGPARKAKKVSAIDAMRNKTEIKSIKIKRRKSGLITKIFGIEGSIAYKNIRRTPAKFIITVIALTISLIMFNVFYGFIDYSKQMLDEIYGQVGFDAQLLTTNEEGFKKVDLEKIEREKFSEYGISIIQEECNLFLPKDKISEYAKGIDNTLDSLGYKTIQNVRVYVCDDKFLDVAKDYIKEGDLDKETLENNGVIILDESTRTNEEGIKEKIRSTNYNLNDSIVIPKAMSYQKDKVNNNIAKESIEKKDFYKGKVAAFLKSNPLEGSMLEGSLCFIIYKDSYEKYIKEFNPNVIMFDFKGDKVSRSEAVEYFDKLNTKTGYEYFDVGNELNQIEDIYDQVEFFVYCFIIVVTIISIVNIFNTISTNLLLRKREFSTLKAIGMKEKQLKKCVLVEGTLYGVISAILGGSISILLLMLLIKLSGGIASIEYHFAFIPFILSIIVSVIITYISTLIPLNKLKKLSIVEGIKEEE